MANHWNNNWFLDLEPNPLATIPSSTSAETLQRPWQQFWPPISGSSLHTWLCSEYPEVLDWRFQADRPFDRPWRSWTRSARAKQEELRRDQVQQSPRLFGNAIITKNQTYCVSKAANIDLMPPGAGVDQQLGEMQMTKAVSAEFNYLEPLQLYHIEKPYLSRLPSVEGMRRSNIVQKSYSVTVFDVRGHENNFTLKDSGFQFFKFPIEITSWTDDRVRSVYLPLVSTWLKNIFGCDYVLLYAYNFRGQKPTGDQTEPWKSPFFRAHCDATARSCFRRLELHLPDEAARSVKSRRRFVNIWRPLTGPDQDCPLALCDCRTVRQEDLVEADMIFPHYCDEGYELKYSPRHRWFYKQGMSTDEVIVFKLDDSSNDEAKLCPHSAFVDYTVTAGTPPRASIEVRAIIIG